MSLAKRTFGDECIEGRFREVYEEWRLAYCLWALEGKPMEDYAVGRLAKVNARMLAALHNMFGHRDWLRPAARLAGVDHRLTNLPNIVAGLLGVPLPLEDRRSAGYER